MTDKERLARYDKLNLSPQEKLDLLYYDKEVEAKGSTNGKLTGEQAKVEKTMRGTGTRTVYKFNKRKKKENTTKAAIIEKLTAAVGVECEVVNPEKEFIFFVDGVKYKVVLSAPRT